MQIESKPLIVCLLLVTAAVRLCGHVAATCVPRHTGVAACPPYLGLHRKGLPSCNMSEQAYLHGSWKPVRRQCRHHLQSREDLNAHAYQYESACNAAAQFCPLPETDHCATKVLQIARWQWIPRTCNFDAFDAGRLSAHVGRRRVLFVGDRNLMQQFVSLRHLMRNAINADKDPQAADWNRFLTRDGGRFMIEPAQFLAGSQDSGDSSSELGLQGASSWLQLAQQADILVISTGHQWAETHLSPNPGDYWAMIVNVLTSLRESFLGSHLIFRTSNWGHYFCINHTRPFGNLSELQENMKHDDSIFHWTDTIWQEGLWSDVAHELGLDQVHSFKVNNVSLTMLRGDAHVDTKHAPNAVPNALEDCLHSCLPGVPDHWNRMLFHTLVSEDLPRSSSPVDGNNDGGILTFND